MLFLLAAWAAAGEEHVAVMKWRDGTVDSPESKSITLLKTRPPLLKVPVEAKDALFGSAIIGDGARLSVAVTPKLLWIDRDMDGDLTKERPRNWLGDETRRYCGIHLKVPFKGEKKPAGISVVVTYRTDGISARVLVTPRTFRRGFVELGMRLREVWLVDGNGNLRFDDPREDMVYIDIDGDARVETGIDSHEASPLGRPFRLGEAGYTAHVADPSGRVVVFRPWRPAPPRQARPWRPREPKKGGVRAPATGDIDSLERQVEKYKNADPLIRRWAIGKLGEHGSPQALRLLTHIYKLDKSEPVRAAAVEAMGYINYKANAEKVARIALSSDDVAVRAAAVRALHGMGMFTQLGGVCTEILAKAQTEPLSAVAAEYLAYTGTETARATLLAASKTLPRLRHRHAPYLFGTRYFRTPPAHEFMIAAGTCPDPRLRFLGLKDLHYFGWPDARVLALAAAREAITDTKLGLVVTEILGAAGDADAVETLLPIADRAGLTAQSHLVDVLRLVRDPTGIAVMSRAVAARQDSIRLLVARVLERIVTPRTTAALIAQLRRERVTEVQIRLLRALARHGTDEAGPALVDFALRNKDSDALRKPLQRALATVGMQHAAVRKYFLSKLTSKSWEDRVRAIDLLARSKDKSLVPAIVANLRHERWQVRVAAAEAFRTLRVKEAIEPLIAQLEIEGKARVVRAIVQTLTRLTGQKLFDDAKLWRQWWMHNKATFKIPKRKKKPKPDEKPKETKTVAQFYGLPVESDRVVFVIDMSGSMESGTRFKSNFEIAVEQMLGVAKRLPDDAKINVILFESDFKVWREKLTKLTKRNRKALKTFMQKQYPEGGTNLYDALEHALKHKGVDTILLLSDGEPTAGRYQKRTQIIEAVREINELKRITIHCVSVVQDSRLLRVLARYNGGLYTVR